MGETRYLLVERVNAQTCAIDMVKEGKRYVRYLSVCSRTYDRGCVYMRSAMCLTLA